MEGKMRIDSYTMGVAPRKNHHWTIKEYQKIMTLRKKRYKNKDIANIMGISKIQVDNAFRLLKAAVKNTCRSCGCNLTGDEVAKSKTAIAGICDKCREQEDAYKKEQRDRALAKGLCGKCYKNPVIPGTTACPRCISATPRRRNREGKCAYCGKNPISKNHVSLCDKCADIMNTKKYQKYHHEVI
jgi:hypothetical protein